MNKRAVVLSKEFMATKEPKHDKEKKIKREKKPKATQRTKKASKGSKGRKKTEAKKSRKQKNATDKEPCNSCKRFYDDPEFDSFPWGQCVSCSKWYHGICDEHCYA